MTLLKREDFHTFQTAAKQALEQSSRVTSVLVCGGTGRIAGGSLKICENIKAECEKRGLSIYVGLKHHTDEEKVCI